jgi:hypothetical protein
MRQVRAFHLSPVQMNFLIDNLVHIAALFTLVCFFFRDQIRLRIFAAVGDALLSLYYYLAFDPPLWNPMVWTVMNVVVNITILVIIIRDGRLFEMTDQEMNLFRNLEGLTPGQFRRLVKAGTWHTAESETQITTEGEHPRKLYYVLEGAIDIEKSKRHFKADAKLFIGELAFLRKKLATATVRLGAGANYIAWDETALEKLFARHDDIRNAVTLILGRDMAEKVAKT